MATGPDELRGRLLGGRYRIGAVLGRGGMGTVYEAVQESLGRPVAVKVLHPLLSHDADTMARFRKEAEQAGSLSHPHIVHVLDFGFEPGGPAWIAMERLQGESLGQRISRVGVLGQGAVVTMALETLSALQAAHEARLVHRDLKPDNIFLARAAGVGEVVKVLDFGIAKLLDGGAAAALTATGMVMGTPLYMSPEQAQGRVVDARADLYSLGAVLFEALSGKPPLQADSYTALLITIVTEPAPSLAARRPDVHPGLAALVDRTMAKDPGARFASAREMADAIRSLGLVEKDSAPAVSPTDSSPLALAATVEGTATPPAPAAPPAPSLSEPGRPARGPLVRLRWPRAAGIGTILVAVLAVFAWVGSAELSPSGSAPTAGAPAPVAPGASPSQDTTTTELPSSPPSVPIVPAPPVTATPGPTVPRPPPHGPGVGARVVPGSFVSPSVPNVRAVFQRRSDWASCWPPEEAPPSNNRSRCLDVSVSGAGQVTAATPSTALGPESFVRCLAERTRTLSFDPPATGEPATLRVCFSIRPGD